MFVLNLLVFVLTAFVFLCNGLIEGEIEGKRFVKDESPEFHEMWEELVEDSQDTKFGRRLMRIFYFIPSIHSIISSRRCQEEQEEDMT